MILKLRVNFKFGYYRVYADCITSERICMLMRRTNYTKDEIGYLRDLGYKIKFSGDLENFDW